MKQHATIADIFDAKMRAASPFLQERTAELKERNDLELKVFSEEYAVGLEQEIKLNPFNGDYNAYLRMLNAYSDQKFAEARARQTSPYSQRELDKMERFMRIANEKKAMGENLAFQYNWREDEHAKRLDDFFNSGLDMPCKFQAMMDEHRWHADQQGYDQPRQTKEQEEIYKRLAVQYLGRVDDVDDLEYAMKAMHTAGDFMPKRTVNTYDEAGNVTGTKKQLWSFPGQEEWEKALIEQETERINRQRMEGAQTADAVYRRLWAEGKGAEAEALAEPWRDGVIAEIMRGDPEKYREAKNYASGKLDRVAVLFMPRDERGPRLEGASGEQVKKYMEVYRDEVFTAYLNGETSVENAAVIQAKLPEQIYDQVVKKFGYEGSFEQFTRDHIDFFASMEDSLMKIAKRDDTKASIPTRVRQFEKAIEGNVKLQELLATKYKRQSEFIVKDMIREYTDYLTSVDWNTITKTELAAGADKIIGKLASKELQLIGAAAVKSPFTSVSFFGALPTVAQREERLATGLGAIADAPGLVTTYRGQKIPVTQRGPDSNPEQIEQGLAEYYTESKHRVAMSLPDLDAAKLRQVNEIDVKRDEENPAAIFQYGDEGVFFRVRQNPENQKQIVIEKQETAGRDAAALRENKWTPVNVNRDWTKKSELDAALAAEKERQAGESRVDSIRARLEREPNNRALQQMLEREEIDRADLINDIRQTQDARQRKDMIESAVEGGILSAREVQELFGFDINGRQGR